MALDFIFVSQIIPQELLNEEFEKLKDSVDIAGNTFYTALLEGLADNGCNVSANSYIPDDNSEELQSSTYNNVKYHFKKYNDNNIVRYFEMLYHSFFQIKEFAKANSHHNTCYAVFNVLRISSVIGGLLACKIFKINTIGVITDVPGYRISSNKKNKLIDSCADKLGQLLINSFDSYVILSEEMTNVIDLKNKKYTVIEGIYDPLKEPNDTMFLPMDEEDPFVILYAGSLHYQYGIMNLVKAIKTIENDNIELAIFGEGEAKNDIIEIGNYDRRIRYCGMIKRSDLLIEERRASLLVNPRPVDDSYVQYSFPSKNLEYMASGTPTVMTNIPSLPNEYKPFLFLVNDNTVELLKETIEKIYDNRKTKAYLDIGIAARRFILQNKNKKVQAKKIIDMCSSIK